MEDWEEKVRAACAAVIDAGDSAEALRAAAKQLWEAATAYGGDGRRPGVLEALSDAVWWTSVGAFDTAEADLRAARYEAAFETAIGCWCKAAADVLERQIERFRLAQMRGGGAASL